MNSNLQLILAAQAGFLFQSLMRMKSLNDLSNVANMHFNPYRDYIKKDIYGILAAFIAPFIWLMIFKEFSHKFPQIQGFIVSSFVLFGGCGSYILQLLFGTAKKRIRDVIDKKTDIADNK